MPGGKGIYFPWIAIIKNLTPKQAFLRVNLELHKPVSGGRGAVELRIEAQEWLRRGERCGVGVVPPPQKKMILESQ